MGRPRRRLELRVEGFEARLLLNAPRATAALVGTGPFLQPGAVRPRIRQAPTPVDPHIALNQYLSALLGQRELEQVRAVTQSRDVISRAALAQRVYQQRFINALLSNPDTYALLNSPAMQQLVGFTQLAPDASTTDTVTYLVPGDRLSIGAESTLVSIAPEGSQEGFLATVPNANVREREDGLFNVAIPIDQIPPGAPAPQVFTVLTGELSPTYQQTGPLLIEALRTAFRRPGPNIPAVVRGLRLPRALSNPNALPGSVLPKYVRLMRVAIEREAFDPAPAQAAAIQAGVGAFFEQVAQLRDAGAFDPAVPPASPPELVGREPLGGTLTITSGALRDLVNAAAEAQGLPLLGLNFPGRIDAGYVIAPNGDYGLILTVRGPSSPAPAGYAPTDLVGGDLRIETSNATSLADLNGLRIQEELTVGTSLMGTLVGSRTRGGTGSGTRDLVTFGGSVGYGTGLSFGTAVSYTSVIPLGNLNAIIPQAPPAS